MPVTLTALGYIPVRKEARLGVQIVDWQYACVKVTASFINESNLGVRMWGFPSAPIVSNRCLSLQYQRMLGRLAMFRLPGS